MNLPDIPCKSAILGSGNIGTDLMMKVLRHGRHVGLSVMAGIDPASDGLARARRLGVATTASGIDGLLAMPEFADVQIVFDATSAGSHLVHESRLRAARPDIRVIDLTPAAVGPYCVPVVNIAEHLDAGNLNMVTCGGQATIPVIAAVSRITPVHYAEIVASIASLSAGPGTRANIDEFTETTARAIEQVGGARRGKAIIVLNPAEPPLMMRDTVYCLAEAGEDDGLTESRIAESVTAMVRDVAAYVPGYRLKQPVQFERMPPHAMAGTPAPGLRGALKVSVFLQVEGAAHYLPAYAGNLDIMTSAALATAERVASRLQEHYA